MILVTLQRETPPPRNLLLGRMTWPMIEMPDAGRPGYMLMREGDTCVTLEDAIIFDSNMKRFRSEFRDVVLTGMTSVKVDKWTTIPGNRKYHMRTSRSNRFKRLLPELLDVPGFTGIRMHAGDRVEDTSGCIILGDAYRPGDMVNSATTVERFTTWLQLAETVDEVWLEVTNP